ncbi:unnamed protein product [Angiostrongylus costaricensis]|uniref:Peptidase_M3 domain-containing protein n=1 Tax=Angiostrongylus costaricensis TaxID=334426 RepID=A0A0R3Q2I4_ANGCS|nr:unnamed protein product [Angiostrongylus costaricensis]
MARLRECITVDNNDFTRMSPEVEWTRQLTPLTTSYGMGQVLQAVLENGSKPSPEGWYFSRPFSQVTYISRLTFSFFHSAEYKSYIASNCLKSKWRNGLANAFKSVMTRNEFKGVAALPCGLLCSHLPMLSDLF